jgi:predicted acetyltransferase
MFNYKDFLVESRYRTHGLSSISRILPNILKRYNVNYNINYNEETDDFQLYLIDLENDMLKIIINRCELIGYFPSYFEVNKLSISGSTLDEFKEIIIGYNLPIKNNIYFQFESWLDKEVDIPDKLYHVYDILNIDKIKRYGLCPKSKNKISHHPDRIYITSTLEEVRNTIDEFKKINKTKKYDFLEITNKEKLKIRKDPNYIDYYTTQNIPPNWIKIK